MTNRLMETACARLCLLTPIAWDESMPPLFSRMAVRRMMECGALSGLVLRRTDMLPQATFERAEMLLTRTSGALLCLEAYEKQGYRLILPESREWPKALRALGGREPLFLFMKGNAALLERRTVAVAGSREIASATNDMAARLGTMLAEEGITMVCGGARRGSRGAGCAVGCRRFVDSRSGGFCGAGLRAGKGSGGAANGQAAAAQRDAAGCAVFCREGVGAQPYHLCVGEKRDCRCGQKRRWRELARGDGGAVRQFFVGLRAGRRRRGFRRKPRAV